MSLNNHYPTGFYLGGGGNNDFGGNLRFMACPCMDVFLTVPEECFFKSIYWYDIYRKRLFGVLHEAVLRSAVF